MNDMVNAETLANPDNELQDSQSNSPANIPEAPTAPAPKKRGRKSNAEKAAMAEAGIIPGGTKPPAKLAKRTPLDVGAMTKQLVGLHLLAAKITDAPELLITEPEAEMLTKSVIAVAEEYDLDLSGKTGAAIQLLGAAAIVYGPRVLAIRKRVIEQKKGQQIGQQ